MILSEYCLHNIRKICRGLNPCFNGWYSQRGQEYTNPFSNSGLNPCFNGWYSQRELENRGHETKWVLILVLMDDTLRVKMTEHLLKVKEVLILVLMDDTLRDSHSCNNSYFMCSLNPCFNGWYSQS